MVSRPNAPFARHTGNPLDSALTTVLLGIGLTIALVGLMRAIV